MKEIMALIQRARRRLFLQELLNKEAGFLCAAFSLVAILQTASCLTPLLYANEASVLCVGASAFAAFLVALVRFPCRKKAARAVDDAGLKERVSTALEHRGEEGGIYLRQREDALACVRGYSLKEGIPIRVRRGLVGGLLIALSLAFGAYVLPGAPKDIVGKKKQALKDIQKVEKEIKESKEIPKEAKEEWKKLAGEARKEMKLAGNEKELGQAKERLDRKIKTRFNNELEDLAGASEVLKRNQVDLERLAESLSHKQREELLEGLKELAEKEGPNQEELAKQLEELGNSQAEELAQSIRSGDRTQLARDQDGEATKNLQNGQNNGDSQGGGQDGQSQNAEGQNPQSQNAQGQNPQGQNPQGQGGKGQNGTGQNGQGQGGTGWNQGSKQGMEKKVQGKSEEKITIPDRKMGTDENLTGKDSGGDSKQVKGESPYSWAGDRVDYNSVLGEYSQKAYAKVEGNRVPSEMSDVVKSYFDALQ